MRAALAVPSRNTCGHVLRAVLHLATPSSNAHLRFWHGNLDKVPLPVATTEKKEKKRKDK